jgi:hypothetical protein
MSRVVWGRKGILVGTYGEVEAREVCDCRNGLFRDEFCFVVRVPRFERKRQKAKSLKEAEMEGID